MGLFSKKQPVVAETAPPPTPAPAPAPAKNGIFHSKNNSHSTVTKQPPTHEVTKESRHSSIFSSSSPSARNGHTIPARGGSILSKNKHSDIGHAQAQVEAAEQAEADAIAHRKAAEVAASEAEVAAKRAEEMARRAEISAKEARVRRTEAEKRAAAAERTVVEARATLTTLLKKVDQEAALAAERQAEAGKVAERGTHLGRYAK